MFKPKMFAKLIVGNIMTPLTGSVTSLCNVSSVSKFSEQPVFYGQDK